MTRIDFYFNAPSKPEVARKLAAKAFNAGQHVLVYTRDAAQAQELDKIFWTAQQLSFLPHVRCGHPLARQTPILIGSDPDELASADILISLDDEPPEFFGRFQRLLEVVSTDTGDRDRARQRFRFFKQRGYDLETHDLATM
jgi:DNA polymerase III subunit chi